MTLDVLILFVVFIFGAAVGSFLNVVAYRCVYGASIFLDRSKCPHCKHKLSTVDLVPVLSFVFLKGRCRYCQKGISWQYPVVEIATGILFVIVTLQGLALEPKGQALSLVSYFYILFVVSVLITIFITDLKDGLIPDKIILPSIGIAFVFKLVLFLLASREPIIVAGQNILSINQIGLDILAGLIAGLFFFSIVLLSSGKAMGGGDIKYALFLGFVLGFTNVAVALFLAFLTGAIVSLILISVGKKRFGQTVAFGPFLSIGAFIALIWGQQILSWYLRLN